MIRSQKSLLNKSSKCFYLLALIFCVCNKVPNNCSDHNSYDPNTQFCFENEPIDKCGGSDFNPVTQGCINDTVQYRCENGELPPCNVINDPVEKRITETFTSSRNWSLPTEVTFPATVEIFLFGAGGGGQGGHAHTTSSTDGNGGSGGSGAAVYIKFEIKKIIDFLNITVGTGGGGTSCYLLVPNPFSDNSWRSADAGGNGEESSIRIGNTNIIAGGGIGGGSDGERQSVNGGNGGTPDPIGKPIIEGATVLEYDPMHGNRGITGDRVAPSGQDGGAALSIGGYSAGRGGASGRSCLFGQNGEGIRGGDGQVVIVITYETVE